jgi:hypothetical protein
MPWKIHRLLARVRMPLVLAGIALMLLSGWLLPGSGLLRGTSLVMFVAGLVLIFLPYSRRMAEAVAVPTQIEPPVRGRWIPVNSPANRVPSHGTHEYGQSYAIDLVHHPDEKSTWTAVRSWPLARVPRSFRLWAAGVRARRRPRGPSYRLATGSLEPRLGAGVGLRLRRGSGAAGLRATQRPVRPRQPHRPRPWRP